MARSLRRTFRGHQQVRWVIDEHEPAEPEFLRAVVRVELEADRRGLQDPGFFVVVHDQLAVDDGAQMIAADEHLDPVPIADDLRGVLQFVG